MASAKSVTRSAPPRASPRWHAVLLVAAVVLVYVNSLRAPFLFDDAGAVLNNPTIRQLASIDVLRPPADGSTTTGRPVVNLSFALNYALSGEQVWSYHAANLALHAVAALTLFGLVRRTPFNLKSEILDLKSSSRHSSKGATADQPSALNPQLSTLNSPAFLAALLWALHPLQTESVVCIAQRTETLCGLFYLLTLYAFSRATHTVRSMPFPCRPGRWPGLFGQQPVLQQSNKAGALDEWRQSSDDGARWPPRAWLALSVTACLLGMATKEVMVTAPLLVFLYDRTFVAGTFSAAWRARRGYYIALAATWTLLGWLVLRSEGARGVAAGFGLGVSAWSYLLKQCEALVLYVRLALWPHPLVLDYGTAVAQSPTEVWWQGLIVVAALAATVWALVRRPVAGFAGACFFLILAPSSSLVPLVTQTMAEHRMYLPLAALIVPVVVMALCRFGRPAAWALGAVAVVFAFGTFARNRDYRDAVTIWSTSVAAYPSSARAHNNLATALQAASRPAEANAHFTRAVAVDPAYVSARYNWGVALLEQGRFAEAITQLETAVRLAPGHADARVNLGNALTQARRPAEAVGHYEHALRLQPAADVHYNLGVALAELNRDAEAMVHLRAALEGNPAQPETHFQIGRIRERAGQPAEAEVEYTATLRLAPDHVAANRKLGLMNARRENLAVAAGHFRAVIHREPADADAHANLGNVLLLQGQPREAIACYEEALRLRPDDPRTQENLRLAREALR